MFNSRTPDGKRNLCGAKVKALRKRRGRGFSQRLLAEEMQKQSIDIDKNAIQRIESGERYVNDFELMKLCELFGVTAEELCGLTDNDKES